MAKKGWIGLLLVVMVMSAAVASADPGNVAQIETDYGTFPAITDGRVNGFDIAAPVVVYYTYEEGKEPETDGAIPNGIELLAVNPATNNGELVLRATSEDIQQLLDGSLDSLTSNGYTLNYTDSGWFWISAAADDEGKPYSFAWENTSFAAV
jgi:hypothetical protein